MLGSAALVPIAALGGPGLCRFDGPVLVDRSAPGAARFARQARRLGSRVTFTDGDLTGFWMQELEQGWRAKPSIMAGFTRPGPASLLQLLAHRNRMRLAVRIDHQWTQTGVRHAVVLPAPLAAAARRQLEPDWIAGAAGLVMADPVGGPPIAFTLDTSGSVPEGEGSRSVSWLIAPIGSADASSARTT